MNIRQIERYMERKGMDTKERVAKTGGGQYLKNFLIEFAIDVRKEALDEVIGEVRKIRAK
jgi:hypothetical protein